METLSEIIYDRVHNQKWFTARGLRSLSQATGWAEETIAKVIACLLFYLLNGGSDWFVCNMLLIIVPMLLIFVYPDEQPPVDHMIVYWISAFVLSACDHMLEDLPFYYLQKFCILLFILVEPSCLNDRLKVWLKVPSKLDVHKREQEEPDVKTAKTSSAREMLTRALKALTSAELSTIQRQQVVTHKTKIVSPYHSDREHKRSEDRRKSPPSHSDSDRQHESRRSRHRKHSSSLSDSERRQAGRNVSGSHPHREHHGSSPPAENFVNFNAVVPGSGSSSSESVEHEQRAVSQQEKAGAPAHLKGSTHGKETVNPTHKGNITSNNPF
ncbi:unnamed protein product [Cylicocyclus nassatus]|uniref:Uncharacterized protein n=1 Tax=Cylicocyclus nassatus TaxID=53992 RepID=A0AA36H5W8_CYLNA|nr:unnamed protein product [Cylicocyclus nassatus]